MTKADLQKIIDTLPDHDHFDVECVIGQSFNFSYVTIRTFINEDDQTWRLRVEVDEDENIV